MHLNRLNHCKRERNVPEEKDGNDGNLDLVTSPSFKVHDVYCDPFYSIVQKNLGCSRVLFLLLKILSLNLAILLALKEN